MNHIPWFKLFAGDWLANLVYQGFDDAERGQCFHLMMICWKQGWIPSDEGELSRRPYCSGPISPRVIALFARKGRGGKQLIHKDLEKQREAYTQKCFENARNGRLGGRPKKTQDVSDNRSVSREKADGLFWETQKKAEEKEKEKRREDSLAHAFSQDHGETKLHEPVSTNFLKAIEKTTKRMHPGATSQMTQQELDDRRQLLREQANAITKKQNAG